MNFYEITTREGPCWITAARASDASRKARSILRHDEFDLKRTGELAWLTLPDTSARPVCREHASPEDRQVVLKLDPENLMDLNRQLQDHVCPDNLRALGLALVQAADVRAGTDR